MANLQAKNSAPAILRNRFGSGEAHLVTTSDGALDGGDPFWAGLARLVAGDPTLVLSKEDAGRYRAILTTAAGGHVLHVVDSKADSPLAPPREVKVSLAAARLGNPTVATEATSSKSLAIARDSGRISFVIRPDPVANVVLK
ncbi:hypothetical protein FJY63_14580 [Candidatus Sumerlaeota bacterium]|nr:hypothetical protein [Candidatus Sumerlaeota bacterium]